MIKSIKTRTPLLALILFVFAVGFTWAANKVVVIPMGGDEVNADVIQDLSERIAALENEQHIPSKLVAAFNSTICPIGWTKFTDAQGRFVVGLNDGGTIAAQWGSPLDDVGSQQHSHGWSLFSKDNLRWQTFNFDGTKIDIYTWGDGMDGAGSGFYPLALDNTSNNVWYYTSKTLHTPPYIQLLYCKKV